jgi:site-specific recombinase XerD
MCEDLQIRNYSTQTIDCYLRCVAQFAQYFGTSPARLGSEQVRQYQLYLIQEKHVSWTVVMQTVCALRFLYQITPGRPEMIAAIPQPKRLKTLPILLSPTEVAALLQAPRHLKTRAILTTLYTAGLRVSELCHLQVTDVDSARMVLRIRQGKGQQDRYVMLAPSLLTLLRQYWQHAKPPPVALSRARPRPPPLAQNGLRPLSAGRRVRPLGKGCASAYVAERISTLLIIRQ